MGQWGISRFDGSRDLKDASVGGLALWCLCHPMIRVSSRSGVKVNQTHILKHSHPVKPSIESANNSIFRSVNGISDCGLKAFSFEMACYIAIANRYSAFIWYLITPSWFYSVDWAAVLS